MTSRDDEFNTLLSASSLGTDAALRLRERTPQTTAKAIRTISHSARWLSGAERCET